MTACLLVLLVVAGSGRGRWRWCKTCPIFFRESGDFCYFCRTAWTNRFMKVTGRRDSRVLTRGWPQQPEGGS